MLQVMAKSDEYVSNIINAMIFQIAVVLVTCVNWIGPLIDNPSMGYDFLAGLDVASEVSSVAVEFN